MADLEETLRYFCEFTEGKKYNTIYADPPWQFQNRTGKVAPEHKRLMRYETMTLEEIKEALGDEITLIDGIPAVMFTDTYPEEALTEMTHRIIDMFAGNLILGISDDMPSTGLIERVELVNKIVNEHNAKVC